MAFRNFDQLPIAGGKITIQPSKLLSFTLTWLHEHLQATCDILAGLASSGRVSGPWPDLLHAPTASQGFPATHTVLPWLASPKWPALVKITWARLCYVSPITQHILGALWWHVCAALLCCRVEWQPPPSHLPAADSSRDENPALCKCELGFQPKCCNKHICPAE